jgi:MYXO-CTERM domain-containing protein
MKTVCWPVALAAACTVAGSATAAVMEVSIFRQTAARASAGSISTPIVDSSGQSNTVMGAFTDTRMASVTGEGAASATSMQDSLIGNGSYAGSLSAAAMAAGNGAGTSGASCSFGSSPNNFSTTFSVAFMVDEPTTARFTGTAVATRSGSGGSIVCQALLGAVLNGVPQGTTIFAQPTANAPAVMWDQMITLMPGIRYSFTANTNATQNNTFNANGGSSNSSIQFNVTVPAPGAMGLLAMAGVCVARRRRR